MRTHALLCAFILMFLLVSTADTGTKKPPPQGLQANMTPILKELPTYQDKSPRRLRWRNIVISPGYPLESLVALAKHLHGEDPAAAFNFFTDGNAQRFREFMLSDIHHATPKEPQYPYPKRWADAHYIAHILHYPHPQHGWRLEIVNGKGVKPPVQWGTSIDLE